MKDILKRGIAFLLVCSLFMTCSVTGLADEIGGEEPVLEAELPQDAGEQAAPAPDDFGGEAQPDNTSEGPAPVELPEPPALPSLPEPAQEAPAEGSSVPEGTAPVVPSSMISTTQTRYVQTGNTGKLNLRDAPSEYASILGSFSNGTMVSVLGNFNGWAYVNVGGNLGYMKLEYLSLSAPAATPTPTGISYKPYTMYVQTGNSGKLHLRQSASTRSKSLGLYPNGTAVTVTATTNGWAYVMVNGRMGYMMLRFLTTRYVPPVPPTPGPVSQVMYVQTGNSGGLHLRTGPGKEYSSQGLFANGTQVKVLSFMGVWDYVQVGGKVGYMMHCYLSYTAPYIPPAPAPTDPFYMYVSTGNSGKLYLRQYASKSSAIIGKYANGTQVLVTAAINDWVYVQVGKQTGFMMRKFLSYDAPTIQPAPVPIQGTALVVHPDHTFVYLRSEKDTSHYTNIITKVPHGSTVQILEWGQWWSLVTYNGMVGYMATTFLRQN